MECPGLFSGEKENYFKMSAKRDVYLVNRCRSATSSRRDTERTTYMGKAFVLASA